MHNLRHTLEQRWSFHQATVMCFDDFVSVFDSVRSAFDHSGILIGAGGTQSSFSRLTSNLWSQCEISLRTKSFCLLGSGALDSALWLRDMTRTSSRQKNVGGLWQIQTYTYNASEQWTRASDKKAGVDVIDFHFRKDSIASITF